MQIKIDWTLDVYRRTEREGIARKVNQPELELIIKHEWIDVKISQRKDGFRKWQCKKCSAEIHKGYWSNFIIKNATIDDIILKYDNYLPRCEDVIMQSLCK